MQDREALCEWLWSFCFSIGDRKWDFVGQCCDRLFVCLFVLQAGLDDGLDSLDDEEYGEENNYDALNDETFGAEANAGDWEKDHEKFSQITESSRPRLRNETSKVGIIYC